MGLFPLMVHGIVRKAGGTKMRFVLFDSVHIAWLLVITVALVVMTNVYKRMTFNERRMLHWARFSGLFSLEVGKPI